MPGKKIVALVAACAGAFLLARWVTARLVSAAGDTTELAARDRQPPPAPSRSSAPARPATADGRGSKVRLDLLAAAARTDTVSTSLLEAPFLSDLDREKFESPRAAVLSWVVWQWMDDLLRQAGCTGMRVPDRTEVSVWIQARAMSDRSVVDGRNAQIKVIRGAPLPPRVEECITAALAQTGTVHATALPASYSRQVKSVYNHDGPMEFPDGFEGTVGGTWIFRSRQRNN
jgi:hypothetical protein